MESIFLAAVALAVIVAFSAISIQQLVTTSLIIDSIPDVRALAECNGTNITIYVEHWRGEAVNISSILITTDNGTVEIEIVNGSGSATIGDVNVSAELEGFVKGSVLLSGMRGVVHINFSSDVFTSGKVYTVIIRDPTGATIATARFVK